jgi:hypothetical protein
MFPPTKFILKHLGLQVKFRTAAIGARQGGVMCGRLRSRKG